MYLFVNAHKFREIRWEDMSPESRQTCYVVAQHGTIFLADVEYHEAVDYIKFWREKSEQGMPVCNPVLSFKTCIYTIIMYLPHILEKSEAKTSISMIANNFLASRI